MAQSQEQDLGLAETFAEVARALHAEDNLDRTLDRICELAVRTVEACQVAGISIAEGNHIRSRSTTNDLPRIVDEIQSETQEGPCIDAIRDHEVIVTDSLSRETRWPEFARRAHQQTGVESILAVRLYVNDDTMGALNLYAEESEAFDGHDVVVASVFAAHAAVALAGAKREEQLEAKAESRDVIGMAKGIIMARQDVSDDEAFDVLSRASQRMNIKLRDMAAQLVRPELTGEPAESTDQSPSA